MQWRDDHGDVWYSHPNGNTFSEADVKAAYGASRGELAHAHSTLKPPGINDAEVEILKSRVSQLAAQVRGAPK